MRCKGNNHYCSHMATQRAGVGFPASLSAILPALGSTLPPTDGSRASVSR